MSHRPGGQLTDAALEFCVFPSKGSFCAYSVVTTSPEERDGA